MLDVELLVEPLVEPDIEPELDDEPEVAPGDDIDDELPGDVVLLPEDALLLVSGVVVPEALLDGVELLLDVDGEVLLLEADDDGVVVVPDEDDDVEAGGVTVTLLVDVGVSEGDLLQAASDSADSKASASIEVRFIRGSWSRW